VGIHRKIRYYISPILKQL